MIEPTAVFGCVVYFQTTPDVAALLVAEVIGEGLAAVNVEIVHHQVDLARKGIFGDEVFDHLGELSRRTVGSGGVEVPPGLRFDDREDVGGSTAPVFVVPLGNVTRSRRP